jgi:hypothetical protein
VDTLSVTFGSTWEPKIVSYDLPTGHFTSAENPPPPVSGVHLSREEIGALIPSVPLLKAGVPGFGQLTLPPRSRLVLAVAERSRSLTITNDFAELSITIAWRSGMIGVGAFKPLCGLTDDEANEFWSPTYVITCEARFSRFRSGHPDMPRYQKWIDAVITVLRNYLDSELLWKETQATYQLGLGRPKLTTEPKN